MEKEKNFASVIFCVRNSEKYIQNFISIILEEFDNNFENFEIVCVNNGSTDNSISILKKELEKNNRENIILNIINLSECVSYEEAIARGVDLAIGDFIFEFDTLIVDYDPKLIMDVYFKQLEGIDVVSLSPNVKKTFTQRMYYCLYNFGVDKNNKIYPERLRVLSRRAINRIANFNNSYALSIPMYKKCGLETKNLFYVPGEEWAKYDKEEFNKRLSKAVETLILYTDIFPKLFILMSIIMVALTIILFIVKMTIYSMISLVGTIILVSVAIILKYMGLLMNKKYISGVNIIKSIEKVSKY